MRRQWLLGLVLTFLLGGWGALSAQNNRLQIAPVPKERLYSQPSPNILPEHIRNNPQGHAPLCRMETRIERQAPVAVWMRLDGPTAVQGVNPGWAALRFRVPLK